MISSTEIITLVSINRVISIWSHQHYRFLVHNIWFPLPYRSLVLQHRPAVIVDTIKKEHVSMVTNVGSLIIQINSCLRSHYSLLLQLIAVSE